MTQDGWGSPQVGRLTSHYIVCGGNALAHRLALELVEQYEVPVAALVPDRTRDHAPRIEQLLGPAQVFEYGSITAEALRAVGIEEAFGIALVDGTDRENLHAALSANGRNPGIRIVLRMFNQRLGEHVTNLLPNCAALSGSATAAPAFANEALRRPNSVQVGDRYLYVAFNDRPGENELCLVADRVDRQDLSRLRLMPPTERRAAEFIALATQFGDDGPVGLGRLPAQAQPRAHPRARSAGRRAVLHYLTREPQLPIPWRTRLRWSVLDTLRFLTSARLRIVMITAAVAVAIGAGVVFHYSHDPGWTAYVTLLDMAGAAQPDAPGEGTVWQHIAHVVITFCGITFVPIATAFLVEALASGRRGLPKAPGAGTKGHVVVVGLGNVGTRVATLVREAGVPVVCLEIDQQARGIQAARALDIPVLIGDAPLADQLRRARIEHSRALVAVTSDDAANLEAALEARAMRPDVRIVVRLFDDDFAHHVYATLGNVASRSVSYLAAPAFAAALMGREVLGTLSVFRHVLLVAELAVDEESGLVGMNRHDIEDPGGVRVIAVRPAERPDNYMWSYADWSAPLDPGDRVIVVATRSGLARINTQVPLDPA